MTAAAQLSAAGALRRLSADAWAISNDWLAALRSKSEQAALAGFTMPPDAPELPLEVGGGLAELRISGTLMRAPDRFEKLFLGAVDLGVVCERLGEAARRSDVRAVLLNIDSPGGTISGTPEAADAVRALAAKKPVLAFTEGLMASAAYWLAAGCQGIVASKSAVVGSIGVLVPFLDMSGAYERAGLKVDVLTNDEAIFKGTGVPGTSLSPDQRANLTDQLNDCFALFRGAIERGRPRVKADAMRGQTFRGWQARDAGLIDAVGDYLTACDHVSVMMPRT